MLWVEVVCWLVVWLAALLLASSLMAHAHTRKQRLSQLLSDGLSRYFCPLELCWFCVTVLFFFFPFPFCFSLPLFARRLIAAVAVDGCRRIFFVLCGLLAFAASDFLL